MANANTVCTETDGRLFSIETKKSNHWTSVYVYLKLLKYIIYNVLRLVFNVAAYVTLRCSFLFDRLSNNLETPNIMEELTKQTLINRRESSFYQNIRNEEIIEINKVDADTIDKLPNIESGSSLIQNTLNDDQVEINKFNADTIDTTLNTEFDSFLNLNIINEEQIEINEVNTDTEYILSTECDSPLDQNINYEQTEINRVDSDSVDKSSNTESKCDISHENSNLSLLDNIDEDAIIQQNSSIEFGTTKVNRKMYRSSLDLITQTLKENKEKADQYALETKLNADRISNNAKNNDNLKPEKVTLNKSESLTNEMKSFLKQGVEKNDSVEVTYDTCINDSFYKDTTDKIKVEENHNHDESKRPNIKSEKQSRTISRESRKSYDSYENRKSLSKNEKLFNIVIDKYNDILSLPPEYALACCVGMDLDVPIVFKDKFGKMGVLMDQYLRLGDVGEILSDENQCVFYLILKKKSGQNTILNDFEKTLNNLLQKMNKYKLTKLAISKSGLEKITVSEAKICISKVFARSSIEVILCLNPLPMYPQILPKKYFTPLHLWEMESQTDLIMFINLEEIYLNNWKDEVVENVNARYPFKDKLLKDITIKPMTTGDILTYKVDKEVLFCIFFSHDSPSYFECLEKAFKEIKSQMTGYRYLGIQQDPLNYRYKSHGISRHLALIKSVFSNFNAEIWICGDTNNHKSQQMQKVVINASEMNKTFSLKSHASSKLKTEKKKYNTTNGFNRTNDLVKNISHNKTSDDISKSFVVGPGTTENWD